MAQPVEIKSSRIPTDPLHSGATLDTEYARQIRSVLLAYGGHKRIEEAMEAELRKTGWMHDMREYVRMLFRTGECKTADEAMTCVQRAVQAELLAAAEREGANGDTSGSGGAVGHSEEDPVSRKMLDEMAGKVKMPESVVGVAVQAVQKEVEKCVEIDVDDFVP